MKYYLDVDLRKNIYYLAPFGKMTDEPFIIGFSARYEADEYLKKLNAGLVKGPLEDRSLYDECAKEELMGKTLTIFRIKKGS